MLLADDLIHDVLARVRVACPAFTDAMERAVESDARKVWGGQQPYVPKRSYFEMGPAELKAAAARELRNGESVRQIAQRLGVDRATIYRHLRR